MAKESELQKIELKVSVNCCDGCKKKVKKALQIEGVLKIEVDLHQPKVVVVGNVDPNKLIKRLSRVGKQAQVLRIYGNQNAAVMEKKGETTMPAGPAPNSAPKEKEQKSKTNDSSEQAKPSSGTGNLTKKDEGAAADSGLKKKNESKDQLINNEKGDSKFPIPAHSEEKGYKQPETDMMMNNGYGMTYGYGAQCAITAPFPCYAVAVPSYAYAAAAGPAPLSLTLPQACCSQEYYCQQPPLFHTPTTRVGDYFSDDNTVGCTVM